MDGENFNSEDKSFIVKAKDGKEFVLLPKDVFDKLSHKLSGRNNLDKDNFGVKLVKYLEPRDLPF